MHSGWAACTARELTRCAVPCAQGIALLLVAAAVALLAVSASASQARTRARQQLPSRYPPLRPGVAATASRAAVPEPLRTALHSVAACRKRAPCPGGAAPVVGCGAAARHLALFQLRRAVQLWPAASVGTALCWLAGAACRASGPARPPAAGGVLSLGLVRSVAHLRWAERYDVLACLSFHSPSGRLCLPSMRSAITYAGKPWCLTPSLCWSASVERRAGRRAASAALGRGQAAPHLGGWACVSAAAAACGLRRMLVSCMRVSAATASSMRAPGSA